MQLLVVMGEWWWEVGSGRLGVGRANDSEANCTKNWRAEMKYVSIFNALYLH